MNDGADFYSSLTMLHCGNLCFVMANQFKVGDVVQLKSGGPKMTVTVIRADGLDCTWFEGVKQHEGNFPPDALKFPEKMPEHPPQARPYNPGEDF
jgi:uncharacterized protein YodC (DUF2158 family)